MKNLDPKDIHHEAGSKVLTALHSMKMDQFKEDEISNRSSTPVKK